MSYFWLTLERIPDDLGFSLYDRTHLCWLLGICAGIVLLAWVCRRICEDTCRRLLQGIGWGMLGLEVLKVAVLLSTGQFRAAYLPLDLCGLSVFLEFAAVWKPHPLLLELLYSLSLPGACLALLFPNWFPLPLWNFFSIHSFVIHGLLVAVPMIFLARGTLRPDWKRLPFCFTMVAAACIPIVWVNHRFHTNFFGSLRNVGVVKSICKQKQTAAYQSSNHGISATGGFTSHGYSCRNRVSFVN